MTPQWWCPEASSSCTGRNLYPDLDLCSSARNTHMAVFQVKLLGKHS